MKYSKKEIQGFLEDKDYLPLSMDFQDGAACNGHWWEMLDGQLVRYEQVAGLSGVYLICTDLETREIIRDDLPWS